MSQTKKLLSLLLAVMMVLVAGTAMAAEIRIPSDDALTGHTFSAYQIFTGTLDTTGETLSNVAWGTGVNSSDLLAALKGETTFGTGEANKFATCEDAAAVAKVLSDNKSDSALVKKFSELVEANVATAITLSSTETNTVADGYYLIKDSTTTSPEGTAFNATLLQIFGTVAFTVKTDAPEVEKKVKEDQAANYNQDGGYGTSYNDVADYDIGDKVPFKLIGTVPKMENYDKYKYTFNDEMSTGLTLDEASIKVYFASAKNADTSTLTALIKGTDYTVTKASDQKFTVHFEDLKNTYSNKTEKYIIVEYEATLNSNAVIGLTGNTNEVYLSYSNNPNDGGDGENGKTEKDRVIVFTYGLKPIKTNGGDTDKPLENAEFVLLDGEGTNAKVAKFNATTHKFEGWFSATPDANGSYDDTYTIKSNADGKFEMAGLDEGTYYLKETKAPDGFNKPSKAFQIVVTATTVNGQTWTDNDAGKALTDLGSVITNEDNSTANGSDDENHAYVTNNISNNAGSTLPETGGMGTTLLYVGGGILVAAAAILLIFKKRLSVEK